MCLGIVLAASPVGALAQTQPIPQIPAPIETSPSGQDQASVPPGPGLAQGWDYSLGVGLGYASNVSLELTDGPSDYGGVLRATLARTLRSPKGEARLSARGIGYLYAEQKEFNSLNGDVALDLSRRLSTRTTGSLALALSSDQTQDTRILLEQGILLPPTRTVGYMGTAGVTFQSTVRTAWRGTVQADRLAFPDSATLSTSSRLRMSGGLDRRLSQSNTLSFEYSAERAGRPDAVSSTTSPVYWTHYGSSQWGHQVSLRTTFLLEAGASYTPEGVQAGLQGPWSFFGGASLNRQVKRSSLRAYYRREVIPVFGVGGLRLADRVGFDANVPFGQRWSTNLGGTYAGTAQSVTEGERQSTTDAYAVVSARASRRLWLQATGRYLRRSAIGLIPGLDDYRGSLSLVLAPPGSTPSGVPWR